MQLYGIPELFLKTIITNAIVIRKGYNEIIETSQDFNYPIKVVFFAEGEYVLVITAYPLKRGQK
ncbi:MAG: hypothetical protein JW838_03655 [Spirochaetes bacterium]|nr:hypothetical protein [Spirochaetota bacterium]